MADNILRKGYLDRDRHQVAWWERGDGGGLPVLVLHGGPGAASRPEQRSHFGAGWRVIHFDQRGCGHSLPSLELRANTTKYLLADIEALREELGIEKWVVSGGSWGSTLAMLYGEKHPERCLAFLLRGVFLCRDKDIDWTFQEGGASMIRPDDFAEMVDALRPKEGESLFQAFSRGWRDPKRRMIVARAWAQWENSLCHIDPGEDEMPGKGVLELSLLEHHYLVRRGFLRENQILEDLGAISSLPCVIVHGRYDLVCPLEGAYELHRSWPGSVLRIARDASHAASEPGIQREMRYAAEGLLRELT